MSLLNPLLENRYRQLLRFAREFEGDHHFFYFLVLFQFGFFRPIAEFYGFAFRAFLHDAQGLMRTHPRPLSPANLVGGVSS